MNICMAAPGDSQSLSTLLPLIVLGLAVMVVCLRVYGRVFRTVIHGEGEVIATEFGIPDVLVVFILGSWLGAMAAQGFLRSGPPRHLGVGELVQSAAMFVTIVGGVLGFLKYRGIAIGRLFGLGRVGPARILTTAAGYLLAAYPLVLLCNILMQVALGDKAARQEILDYFFEAIRHSDARSMLFTAIIGIFVAPALEELLFRGYIYGTLRRRLRPVGGMVVTSLLFAVIHVNGAALPALFVLALCLTLAYEATGSLLVPMTMHAAFNAITLGLTFVTARAQQ